MAYGHIGTADIERADDTDLRSRPGTRHEAPGMPTMKATPLILCCAALVIALPLPLLVRPAWRALNDAWWDEVEPVGNPS